MRILVVLPNWLGDAIMATPALELLTKIYKDVEFTFVGSYVSISALKYHPRCVRTIIDKTKESPKGRLQATLELAKELGKFDIAITLRNQIHSTLLIKATKSTHTIAKLSWHSKLLNINTTPRIKRGVHLAIQYARLVLNKTDLSEDDVPPLKLYIEKTKFDRPTVGINAGATYGSAKRWYPERFAEVGAFLSRKFDIVIFGGPAEIDIANEIEKELKKLNIKNYKNVAGQTSIKELCSLIGGCDFFVTNDSGPMHIAAAYQVPTVSIFGPTRFDETSQWKNPKMAIVYHEIKCRPCMKRTCPLKHHKCMKNILATDVIEAIRTQINDI